MADNKTNIESPSVEQLIPQQLVGDSQALIEFLKEYYKFLNQDQEPTQVINTIVQNRDLDDAVDAYIDMVRKELGYGMATQLEANKVNLYKHIGEFYRAKGSIDSFKLLFRLLFNKNVEISLPKEQILVASDGRWVQQTSLFTDISAGVPFDLVNTFVDIVNTDGSTVKVEVERVRHYQEGIYELVVSRFFVGNILNNATFTSNGVTGTVINSLSGFQIDYPGKKFKVGQLLDVVYGQAIGTKIKVTSVNVSGGITGLEFLSFGVGYPEDFTSQLVPVGFDYNFNYNSDTETYTGSLNDQVSSSEYIYLEINPYCFGFDELQADGTQYAASDYFSEVYGEGLEFVRISDDKYFAEAYLDGQRAIGTATVKNNDNADVTQSDLSETDAATLTALQSLYPNRAIVSFTNTPVSKYSGSYSTNKGFLSDDIYLQDNFYYQQFSYVIKTDEQFSTYEGLVKQTIHPTGMAMFGEFEITNELDASSVIALLATLFRTGFQDVIETSESTFNRTIIKSPPLDQDEVFTSQFVYYEFTKPLEELVLTPNEASYELTKPEVDEIFSTEAIQDFHITKPLISEVIAEDTSLFETADAYALDYFRQDYSEGLIYDTTLGFIIEAQKPFYENINALTTLFEFSTNLGKFDEIITSQIVNYELTKPLNTFTATIDLLSYNSTKPLEDITRAWSTKFTDYDQDVYVADYEPNEEDYFLGQYVENINIPTFDIDVRKPFYETLTAVDEQESEYRKQIDNSVTATSNLLPFNFGKNILDSIAAAEDKFFTDLSDTSLYAIPSNYSPSGDYAGDSGYFAQDYIVNLNVPQIEFDITKPLEESINSISGGRVEINPYSVYYFGNDYIEGSRAIS
jgi:hypothetical protein